MGDEYVIKPYLSGDFHIVFPTVLAPTTEARIVPLSKACIKSPFLKLEGAAKRETKPECQAQLKTSRTN